MTERIQGGYILLARQIIESEIWSKPPLYLKVWVYLLTKAQHSPYRNLDKGQLFTSIPEIQQACSWYIGCRKVTPTKDQIFQVLEWMRKACAQDCEQDPKATMIATTKATHGMLITIDKYCLYQNPKLYESNGESNDVSATKATRKQRQPDNINKNVKNDKNDKNNIYSDFSSYTLNSCLADALNGFMQMRKSIKKPVTERAISLLLSELNKLAKDDEQKIAIVNQSIMHGWQGFFPLKEKQQSPATVPSWPPNKPTPDPGCQKCKGTGKIPLKTVNDGKETIINQTCECVTRRAV